MFLRKLLSRDVRHKLAVSCGLKISAPPHLQVVIIRLCDTSSERAFSNAAIATAETSKPQEASEAVLSLPQHESKRLRKEGFRKFRLAEGVLKGVDSMGLIEPTAIQKKVIPVALECQSVSLKSLNFPYRHKQLALLSTRRAANAATDIEFHEHLRHSTNSCGACDVSVANQ